MTMEFLTGRTVRTIAKSARTAVESFWLDVESWRSEMPLSKLLSDDDRILDTYSFENLPLTDPAVIYSRRVAPASKREEAVTRFSGNLAVTPKPVPVLVVDASGLDPLDDEEFWPIIDGLDGHMWESMINRAAVQLAKRPEEFVLRFAQAAALKMFELDTPVICDSGADEDGAVEITAGMSKWLRGATIARGRDTFERALADPEVVVTAKASDLSWGIALIPGFALDRVRGQETRIITRWTDEAGMNPKFWGDQVGRIRDSPTRPSPAEREERVATQVPVPVPQSLADVIVPPSVFGAWWTARYLLEVDGEVLERVVLFHMGHFTDQEIAGDLVAQNDAVTAGGMVLSSVDLYDTHDYEPMRSVAMQVKRRSSLSLDAYLTKHFEQIADA